MKLVVYALFVSWSVAFLVGCSKTSGIKETGTPTSVEEANANFEESPAVADGKESADK